MGCKDKISTTCGKRVNAKCVKYEGTFSKKSKLEQCDCNDLETVIEDINTQLDDLDSNFDFSELNVACLELPVPDQRKLLGILQVYGDRICELSAAAGIEECADCPTPTDPCATLSTCCATVTAMKYWTGGYLLNTNGTWIDVSGGDLAKTVNTGTGYYKVTVENQMLFNGLGGIAQVGLKIGAVNPGATVTGFDVVTLKEGYSTSVVLYMEINNESVITPVFRKNSGGNIQIDGVKVLIEKLPYQP